MNLFSTILKKKLLFTVAILLLCMQAWSQQASKKSRILFLIDASSSMTYPWNQNNSRFAVATNILLQIVDSVYKINNEVEFAVRSYGTQYPAQDKNCTDTYLEVPFNIQNANQIKTRLKYVTPIGFSPIAYSLRQASENELSNTNQYDYSIIFITDGGESCNGDVCQTFKDFIERKVQIKPYVIGLDKNEQLKSFYTCMGNYIEVTKPSHIQDAVKLIVDQNRPLLDKPKQLNIGTVYSNTPLIKDTEPPVVKKDTVKTIAISKNIFPLLKIVAYPKRIKEIGIMSPSYAIVKKGSVILNIQSYEEKKIETPEPTPVVKRNSDLIESLGWNKNRNTSKYKPSILAKKAPIVANAKATIRFEVDAPIVEIKRDVDVMPRLKWIETSIKKSAVAKIKATEYQVKKGKATISFEVEEPRQNSMITSLENIYFPMKKTSAAQIKGKNYIVKKGKASVNFEVDAPRQDFTLAALKTTALPFAKNNKLTLKAKPFTTKKTTATISFVLEEKKKEVLNPISISKYPMRYSYAFRLPSVKPLALKKKSVTISFVVDPPRKPDTIKAKLTPTNTTNSDLTFTVETINSQETMVQVYFKGPNGKAYLKAIPEIEFRDIATKVTKTSFKREVNGNEPIPQKIEAGKYNLVVTGYNDLYANNVEIQANKINKVYINVTDGTLSFAYMGNRIRPVEFNAIVNRRFAAGATILQKCKDRLQYDPGTYYVEINTLPASKFSIDLCFGSVYEIQIPEPGSLQITNASPYGKIQLQSVLGDQYVTFKAMTIDGNQKEQLLILQPGPYKAIIPVDPTNPYSGTKILEFRVFSNKETLLELK